MVLTKRPKKWAGPRSATIDDEVHDHSEEAERRETQHLKHEVRELKKAEKVGNYSTFLCKSVTRIPFADTAVLISHWESVVCLGHPASVSIYLAI
jgi:hypothetical protein